ncbi:MAG: class I SAM-dependent methyltransferase [Pseudomonadota bacterium]
MRHPLSPLDDPALVLEIATADNFDADRYLIANPDIAAWARHGGDPRFHLDSHGIAEGRKQIGRAFHDTLRARRRAKYAHFAGIFDPARGAGGAFAFLEEPGAFPIGYGGAAHSLSDYDGESAHGGLGQYDDEIAANPDRLYLDIGCGLRPDMFDNCLYVEVYPSRSADLVMAPACTYPIADTSVDGIGCFAVMEHMTEPWIAAAEFRRMLKPGGLLFVDWPFLQPVHGYPSHYYNATREGVRRMFDDGFEIVDLDTRPNQTPERTLLWLLRGWIDGLTDDSVRTELRGKTVDELLALSPRSPFWKSVNAATPPAVRETYAAGNTLVARRL